MASSPTKRVRQELRLNQSEFNQKIRAIRIKLNTHLKKCSLFKANNQKFLEKVNLFRIVTNEPPFDLTSYESYKWLLSIWQEGSHSIIHRTDPLNFYFSNEWRRLRERVLKDFGSCCMKCGGNERISVDHIKPRSLYPMLEFDYDNLQVLCTPCNSSKSNRNIVDYRNFQPFNYEKRKNFYQPVF